jgi:hypothetical protein
MATYYHLLRVIKYRARASFIIRDYLLCFSSNPIITINLYNLSSGLYILEVNLRIIIRDFDRV